LNPRPLVPQTSALTGLRHAPTENGADYRDECGCVKRRVSAYAFAAGRAQAASDDGVGDDVHAGPVDIAWPPQRCLNKHLG
jgi:hypothetical protein